MTKSERKELAADIEQRLDSELDFDFQYSLEHYHDGDVSIVDVEADISCSGDWPDDWNEQVDDIMSDVVSDWGGWYSWDDHCVSISIPDD